MVRYAIESGLWASKMASGSYFVKIMEKKLHIDLKWREMQSKVFFGHAKLILGIQNGHRRPFFEKIK